MDDEYNIVDEKTPGEEMAERFEKRFERMAESERIGRLVRHEAALIDMTVGLLMQTKGWLGIDRSAADLIDDHLEDIFDIVKDMVRILDKESKGGKNGRAD